MKSVYQTPFVITLCIDILLNIGGLVVVSYWEGPIWQAIAFLLISLVLLTELYLLSVSFRKPSPISKATFFLFIFALTSLSAALYILYQMQPLELLLRLYFGLVILWHVVSVLILGMSIFEQSPFWNGVRKRFEPASLLILSFTFFLFAPLFYEFYARFDYELQREAAITAALKRENIRFDLYAQLFESIDEPQLKFKHFPNVSLRFQNSDTDYYQMSVQTNSLGFRDDEVSVGEIQEDDFVVLFLGDSVTFGVGVEADETFVEQSESLLADYFQWQNHHPQVLHINMGVGSYGLIEVVEALKYSGAAQFKPDVIIYSYNINDYSDQVRGLDQETGALVPFRPRSFFLWDLQRIFRPQAVDIILTQKLDELRVVADRSGAELIVNILPAEPQPQQWPSTFQYEGFFDRSYQFIKNYVNDNQLMSIDGITVFRKESLHEYLLVRPNYQDDGNHYNQVGHQLMAKLVTLALLETIMPQDALGNTIEEWGGGRLEHGQPERAKEIYQLLFQSEASRSLPDFETSFSLQENYNVALSETALEKLTLDLNFLDRDSYFTNEEIPYLPTGWNWQVVPECTTADCSIQNCLTAGCHLVDAELGLPVTTQLGQRYYWPEVSFEESAGTIVLWYRAEEAAQVGPPARLLWSYWLDNDNRAYINLNAAQGLVAGFKTADWQVVSEPVDWQANEWHQIAMSWDARFPTLRLYIDGELAMVSFQTLDLPLGGGHEALGSWAHDGSTPAEGYFAQFSLYSNQLNAEDIMYLYHQHKLSLE